MAGTYSQIYLQVVFAVKGRVNLISPNLRDELYKYVAGIIKNKEQKPIIVNGMRDHIHLFIIIYLIRKSITEKRHSMRNTWISWRDLGLNTTKNIYLIGLIKTISPLRGWYSFGVIFLKSLHPFRIILVGII